MTESENIEYMNRAIELAREAAAAGEIPVGAVIVDRKSGEILGEGRNKCEKLALPTAHAEIIAIEAAAKKVGNQRLSDTAIYITLEPCPMCAGAILNAQIDEIYFGAYDPRLGAAGSVCDIFDLRNNRHPGIRSGICENECLALLRDFFKKIRKK